MDRPLVIGKGSFTKSKTNKSVYYIRHNMGKDPITGKYRYSPRRKVYARNKSELRLALEEYKAELNNGTVALKKNVTVQQYAQTFHALREHSLKSPLSYKREALEVKHICELFGAYGIQDLRTPIIKKAYADARKTKRFSESELHKIHTKLNQIMKSALADEIILKNPCDGISVPRPEGKERESLSASEANRLHSCLLSSGADSHTIATEILLETGMRRAEVLGLVRGDVDIQGKTIYVSEQFAADKNLRDPKSRRGKRRISIGEDLSTRLEAWFELQDEQLSALGLATGPSTPVAHVLRDKKSHGRAIAERRDTSRPIEIAHMDPNNYSRWFRNFCSDNGFGKFTQVAHWITRDGKKYARGKGYVGLTPHMLRHTQATLLIGANIDIKTVSTRLGHSSVKLTLDTYAHAIEAKDREATEVFDSLLRCD